MARIPVSIITGYLGGGKTTLIRKIIDEVGERIAILMNEFGEISIDSEIIKGKAVDMVELAGGCVCCSLTGEFEAAVKEIVEYISPSLIVVETTGVAEPDAIIIDVQENLPQVRLDALITVVDADGVARFPSIGHTSRIQIELADIILINKIDLVNEEELRQVDRIIRSINPDAQIFKTVRCNIDTGLIFGIGAGYKEFEKRKHRHLEEEYIESFTFVTGKALDRGKFEDFLNEMPKDVFRSKGFIRFTEGSYLFNFVNGRYGFEEWEKREKTELVFIGRKISEFRDKALSALCGCEV